jgi:UDP-glucose 4-epimerase
VTGACGFIGRHICHLTKARGDDWYGVDVLNTPPLEVQPDRYVKTDSLAALGEFIEHVRPEVCIHAAGLALVRESIADPAPDFSSGPSLTFALLDALRRNALQCRVLFLSSAAVYGNPVRLPASEDSPAAPISPYGFHKLQCELLCREFTEVYGLKTAVARIFSAYGEGLRRQVLFDICRKILCERRLALRGTGQETRDFLHVRDIAAGVLRIADAAPMTAEAYNLASGHAVSISDLAKMAAAGLGIDITPEFDGVVPLGDPRFWQADTTRIGALGFVPTITLEVGIKSYAHWARQELG